MRRVRLGTVEVSRIVMGGNPFSGFSHQGPERDREMIHYYTSERIMDALAKAEAAGIDTFFGRSDRHVTRMLTEYWDRGGKIQWFAQGSPDMPAQNVQTFDHVVEGVAVAR